MNVKDRVNYSSHASSKIKHTADLGTVSYYSPLTSSAGRFILPSTLSSIRFTAS